mmetsp:Transcript_36229/g.98084  ORF Transcript_36229/g.98084 Transcript_36229/m.98084 type:complete len:213 (+) Transcript_36229:104-742(+)
MAACALAIVALVAQAPPLLGPALPLAPRVDAGTRQHADAEAHDQQHRSVHALRGGAEAEVEGVVGQLLRPDVGVQCAAHPHRDRVVPSGSERAALGDGPAPARVHAIGGWIPRGLRVAAVGLREVRSQGRGTRGRRRGRELLPQRRPRAVRVHLHLQADVVEALDDVAVPVAPYAVPLPHTLVVGCRRPSVHDLVPDNRQRSRGEVAGGAVT